MTLTPDPAPYRRLAASVLLAALRRGRDDDKAWIEAWSFEEGGAGWWARILDLDGPPDVPAAFARAAHCSPTSLLSPELVAHLAHKYPHRQLLARALGIKPHSAWRLLKKLDIEEEGYYTG